MASIYDNSPQEKGTEFKSINLSDSGTFQLIQEAVPKLAIHNDGGERVRIYKTENHTATTSGTSNATGVYIGVEDGVTFTIAGIGNCDQISAQLENHLKAPYELKYIVFK